MIVIFWVSIFAVFFAYCGYPLSLYLFGLFTKKRLKKDAFLPSVTLIITAYNEEKSIEEKLQNTINIDYPKERLQILVASDGSTDRTNDIVKQYGNNGVELLAITVRNGKEAAQKEAVKNAKGDILVFTDVATKLDADGIREIVNNFSDEKIGCASSEDRLVDASGKPVGESLYVKYEMWLRRLETRVNSLVGLSGSFFAARKEICLDFSSNLQSDFRTLLNCVKRGQRGVSDSKAIGYYLNVSDEKNEFNRKVRTVVRGLTVFFQHIELLNVFRYGFFSYQMFCHKLLRWFVPFFIVTAFVTNALLAVGSLDYSILFIFQCLFYSIAAWWQFNPRKTSNLFFKIPHYFLTVNAAIAVAWWHYLWGRRVVMWNPSER
jgi:cellulose synthase/poly-beta-1,6-N-acetylglucosamine synthase-like glycosyltransferase